MNRLDIVFEKTNGLLNARDAEIKIDGKSLENVESLSFSVSGNDPVVNVKMGLLAESIEFSGPCQVVITTREKK